MSFRSVLPAAALAALFVAVAASVPAHARSGFETNLPDFELPVDLPDPADLGLKASARRLDGGQVLIRIDDIRTGEATEILQSKDGRTSTTRQLDSKGNELEIVRVVPGQLTEEHRFTLPRRKTVRTFGNGLAQVVEEFVEREGKWHKTGETRLGPEASMVCNGMMPEDDFERMLASTSRPILALAKDRTPSRRGVDEGYFRMTHNLRSTGCETGDSMYPDSGVLSLMSDLQASWDQGIRCMNNLGRRHENDPSPVRSINALILRSAARKLMGNFVAGAAKRFTIVCEEDVDASLFGYAFRDHHLIGEGTDAQALTCPSLTEDSRGADHFPGIVLNIARFRQMSEHQRRSTLFHELLHHIPVYHHRETQAFDFVYNLTYCCFGTGGARARVMGPEERDSFPPDNFDCDDFLNQEKLR